MTENQAYLAAKKQIKNLEKEIAKNRKAIEAVKREKLFSEKVLNSLPGIFYLYTENGEMIRWNKNHETLTGFSAEELPQRSMFDWFSGNDKERVAAVVEKIYTDGNLRSVEANLIIKSGKKIPYHFTGVGMTVNRQKYLLGMGLDLTEQKRTEDALRESEEKYRAIFENAVEGIYQTTPKGTLVSANPAMAHILGYNSTDELMSSIKDVSKDLYFSRSARKRFLDLMRNNESVSGYEVEFLKKDGSRIWASLHARPIADDKGRLQLIEGIFFDITEQKQEADSLREREEHLRKENIRLRSNIKDRYRFGDIIGKSDAMQNVYEMILKAAASDANVIIYGESGTGKELVARAIHKFSDRKAKRFVPVNCGAIPENLLESEFFGYKKGAFTGATTNKQGYLDLADKGVLFLDELGEIGTNMQVKLLRVLEGGGYTPVGGLEVKKTKLRVIAATNRNLEESVASGTMREDFFYRIHIVPIYLPPLRKRKEDIPLLIEHFMKTADPVDGPTAITGEMIATMIQHDWPGNIRELQNVLHRYQTLNLFDLPASPPAPSVLKKSDSMPVMDYADQSETFHETMDRVEKALLLKSLESNQWHRENAAKSIGMPQRTFYRKIKRHNLIRHK